MKSNIEILKEKRNFVISELTTAFSFKVYELKSLMTEFVAYIEVEGFVLFDEKDFAVNNMIKIAVKEFFNDKGDSYKRNIDAMHSFTEQQNKISKQHFNN